MLNFTTLPPLSLYIHYPWCAQKCPYCDFNSHTVSSSPPLAELADNQRDEQYINALLIDFQLELPEVWGRTVQSIFIGGGTPSLMQPEQLHRLLSHIRSLVKLSPMAEITMEANPGTVDQKKFAEFHSAGINRLSMGIQSFDDTLLQKIGRIHNSQQARQAIERAQCAGFDNINLDLMYGLPGQTLAQAIHDVQQALQFHTTHISHYQLTLEPNTLFYSQPPPLPDDDLSYEMQLQCQQLLAENDFQHYEISAYCKADYQCRHNLNYWQFGDYIGIGAGAHGKISDARQQKITRRWKEKHPLSYINNFQSINKTHSKTDSCSDFKQSFVENSNKNNVNIKNSSILISDRTGIRTEIRGARGGGEQQLSRDDICFEFMLNASRLVGGFKSELFAQQTGLAINHLEKGLQKAVELDLIRRQLHHIKPTERGLQYLNELQEIFL